MKKKLFFIGLLSFLIVILFIKCNKMVDAKIQGTWRQINVANLSDSVYHEWLFKNDSIYITEFRQTKTALIVYDVKSVAYAVEYKKRKRWITVPDQFLNFNPDFKYQIVRLDKQAMVIVVQEVQKNGEIGGYSLLEFERKK